MTEQIVILGFAGSLRRDSYNKALLHAASELVPKDAKLEIFGLEGIPPFNQDLEDHMPEKVKNFKAKIKAADALLIATPEHNYSVPEFSRMRLIGLLDLMMITLLRENLSL